MHETRARYVVEELPPFPPPAIGGRLLGGALRAAPRATALARQGRHAAAVRVLARGLRVLEGRERNREGTTCALQLGWLALERGDVVTALGRFETARALAEDPDATVLASVGAGTALIEADRLVEAEAVLRGAVAAAETLQDPDGRASAVAALARCLYWQRRWHDALALIAQCSAGLGSSLSRVRIMAIHARCLAQVGRTSEALRTARESQAAAGSIGDPGDMASAELAVAEALIAAGDADGAQGPLTRAIHIARSAHLPLARVRAFLVLASVNDDGARGLKALGRIRLPPLLAARVARAAASADATAHRPLEPVAQLEVLLGLSQQAADDGAALSSICAAVLERLAAAAVAVIAGDDRVLCLEGRSWPSVSAMSREAFAAGAGFGRRAGVSRRRRQSRFVSAGK